MYGVVNQAIEELVVSEFGQDIWEKARQVSGVEEEHFITSLVYDDSITFRLAGAVAEVLGAPLTEVLRRFGQWWILDTGKKKYGHMLSAAGHDFETFLNHLPRLHATIQVVFTDIEMPEFEIHNFSSGRADVHYYSSREGLGWFAYGIFEGLAEMFQVNLSIDYQPKAETPDSEYELFAMTWVKK